jgi:hypothetical protein
MQRCSTAEMPNAGTSDRTTCSVGLKHLFMQAEPDYHSRYYCEYSITSLMSSGHFHTGTEKIHCRSKQAEKGVTTHAAETHVKLEDFDTRLTNVVLRSTTYSEH